jgi:hypothetical protein
MVCWILFMPFRLLGWVFKGFAGLLMLPFILIACLLGAVLFGVGILMFSVPVLPFALIALFFMWWFRRRPAAVQSRI